jgi:hypothetical protein
MAITLSASSKLREESYTKYISAFAAIESGHPHPTQSASQRANDEYAVDNVVAEHPKVVHE